MTDQTTTQNLKEELSNQTVECPDTLRLLTAKEASTALSISLSKVYALKDTGKLPFYPIDGCIRFAEQDLRNYLASVRVERRKTKASRRNLREMFQ